MRAVIGPNGAGKTTFMDIVTGKTRPDTGTVRWGEMGHSLLSLSEAQIAREGIGRKFQRPPCSRIRACATTCAWR
jgi:urea transport system ATP-binding protein